MIFTGGLRFFFFHEEEGSEAAAGAAPSADLPRKKGENRVQGRRAFVERGIEGFSVVR